MSAAATGRLDDFACRSNLPKPDPLKLDIQGFELEALRGATITLAYASTLLTEVSFVGLYEEQCSFPEVLCFHLCAFGISTAFGAALWQSDVLFLKEQARTSPGLR